MDVAVTVSTDSLRCDEPAIRQKYGLTRALSDKDRAKIQTTMESADQMDIETYPTMEFHSTKMVEEKENSYVLNGDLTIHGVTKTVSFPLAVQREGENFRGKASIPFKQSDFGITPYGLMFGMIRVQDEATLYVDILIMPAAGVMDRQTSP
jgi:polyisoprenoid-binding protein YceI